MQRSRQRFEITGLIFFQSNNNRHCIGFYIGKIKILLHVITIEHNMLGFLTCSLIMCHVTCLCISHTTTLHVNTNQLTTGMAHMNCRRLTLNASRFLPIMVLGGERSDSQQRRKWVREMGEGGREEGGVGEKKRGRSR